MMITPTKSNTRLEAFLVVHLSLRWAIVARTTTNTIFQCRCDATAGLMTKIQHNNRLNQHDFQRAALNLWVK